MVSAEGVGVSDPKPPGKLRTDKVVQVVRAGEETTILTAAGKVWTYGRTYDKKSGKEIWAWQRVVLPKELEAE